jgi:hypothetical protein
MSTVMSLWYLPMLFELPLLGLILYFYFKWRPKGADERKLRTYDIVAVFLAVAVRPIVAVTAPFPPTADPLLAGLVYALAVQYSLPLFLIAAGLLRNLVVFRILGDSRAMSTA